MSARNRIPPAVATGALAAVLALAGCDAGPGPTAAPDRTPGGSGAPLAAPTVDDVAAAIDALDSLGSYRFVQSAVEGEPGTPSQVRGVVVNGPQRRTSVEYTAEGAFTGGQVTIGGRVWVSVGGAAYQEQEVPGASGGEIDNPVALLFDPWALGIDALEDLGVEEHGGVAARHLRGDSTSDDELDEDGFPTGSGFTGTTDAWIAVDGGYLLAARAVGSQRWPVPGEGDPEPSATAYTVEVAVDGVDDPANVVQEPLAGDSTPPGGDPAATALIRRIPTSQAALDAYVYRMTSDLAGTELTATLTVVNRPTRAAHWEIEAIAGFERQAILLVGKRAWSRSGDGAWVAGEGITCGAGSDLLSDEAGPCTFARLTDVAAGLDAIRTSFTVVSTDGQAAGTASTHLRSQAGRVDGGSVVAGTTDLWIANEGGYVVRSVFTGMGISSAVEIRRVNDPSIDLRAP